VTIAIINSLNILIFPSPILLAKILMTKKQTQRKMLF
jgi:hypothetical protein